MFLTLKGAKIYCTVNNFEVILKEIESTKTLADLIKNTRKKQGLTQAELAAASGVGVRFIVDLEKGKLTCEIGKTLNVLKMLGITLKADEVD